MLLAFQWTFAQSTGTIKGNVKDAGGNPLASASVTVEGQRGGTLTDAAGNYSLKVKPGTYTLVVTYVGATAQRLQATVAAGQTVEVNTSVNVSAEMTDVVVLGADCGPRAIRPRSSS